MLPLNELFLKEVHDWSEAQGFWKKEANENQILMAMSKLALIHSEVSEATEEVRRGRIFDKACSFELADIIIRVINFCTHYKIDINEALLEKHQINLQRTVLKEDGKQI